jgi:hypothetical protein
VQVELECGNHPEIAPCTSHAPVEVGILVGAGMAQAAIGGDDVDGFYVVQRQSVAPGEPAEPPAGGEPPHAGM